MSISYFSFPDPKERIAVFIPRFLVLSLISLFFFADIDLDVIMFIIEEEGRKW